MTTFQLQERPVAVADGDVLATLRSELDAYYRAIVEFGGSDIREILRRLAAMSGRASELRGQIMRNENRRMQAFRTRELDPFIEELERQFRIWSRFQTVQQFEWDLSKGGM